MPGKSEAELFDEAVSRTRGVQARRLPDDSPWRKWDIFPEAKDKADRLIDGFRNGGRTLRPFPRVIVDYTNRSDANAFAFKYGDNFFIAVNYGTVCLLKFLIARMMSIPAVLPEIGDVRCESSRPPVVPFDQDFMNYLGNLSASGCSLDALFPKDQNRIAVASLIADLSVNFLMGHEFRHIQAGHCTYRSEVFGADSICEADSPVAVVGAAMQFQAMEYDADMFPFGALINAYCINRFELMGIDAAT